MSPPMEPPPLRENSNQKFERQRNGQERASLIQSGGLSASGRSTGTGGGNFRHWHLGLRQAWKEVGHKGTQRRHPGDSTGAWSWTGGPGELSAPPKSSYTAVGVCIEVGLEGSTQVVTPWKPFYGHLKTNSPIPREKDNPFLLCQGHCPGSSQNLTPDKRRQLQRVLVAERGAQDSHPTYQYVFGQVSSLQWASVSPSVK